MSIALSTAHRSDIISNLRQTQYDLLVIGGGITGAGIALDASARGLKVALIEKDDFASGTSSKSTKLVHGGLRYLKQMEVALVREVGRERAIVHQLAPHLVIAEKMLLPLVKGGTYGKLATSVGLRVYDLLAGVRGDDRRVMLSKEETLAKAPQLRSDILVGGGFYAEYRTDDARLTIEILKTAYQYGAEVLNHVKAVEFIYEQDRVKGVKSKCKFTDALFEIKADQVVSAAGPWVDQLRSKDHSLQGKRLFHSKGVHIVVPHERLPLQHSIYFDVPDGRMIFAIPRHRATYIGTTDTPYEGDLNNIPIFEEDVRYLLGATNQMFPEANLKIEDIESSWAGLRPLIYEEGKSASEMSRKDEVFISDSGLISIAGGKLTGYRKMAEKATDLVVENYRKKGNGKPLKKNQTAAIKISGGPFANAREVAQYQDEILARIEPLNLTAYYSQYLVANYGRQTEQILEWMDKFPEDQPEVALARAELRFAMEHELAATALDFIDRRTGRLYFNYPSIGRIAEPVLQDMQKHLGWTEERLRAEREELETQLHLSANFPEAPQEVKSVSGEREMG